MVKHHLTYEGSPTYDFKTAGMMQGSERWAILHLAQYTTPARTASWFYKDWLPLSQEGCCGAVLDYVDETPVLFDNADVFFDSGVHFHNAINRKLGNLQFDVNLAKVIWRKIPTYHRSQSVPIVSSIAPNRVEHQIACINSWLEAGFYVHLMQTPAEIEAYRHLIMVDWIPITTERPLIREMVKYGMIINSDCMMLGNAPYLLGKNQFYLRWNYEPGTPSQEEQWGLDACYIEPDVLPSDFPFMIGEPFWDYAVPAFLRNDNVPFSINHNPWLHHLRHPLNWNQDDWHRGHDWVRSRLVGDFSSSEYRKSLDPDYVYHKAGIWITPEEQQANKVTLYG